MLSTLDAKKWLAEKRRKRVLEQLQNNGFSAFYVSSAEIAQQRLLDMIPLTATVGIGGSITLRTLGIVEALTKRGNKVANHWQPHLTQVMRNAIRRQQLNSDIFLSSSNAVTMDGKLVNIDGSGNRVASMIFGPKKVIVVVGVNKVVINVEAGIIRARNIASSMNARRLGCTTPCSKTGVCDDDQCSLPERICRIITILERKPSDTDFTIILVGEELGY